MGTSLSTVEGGPKALIEAMETQLGDALPKLGVTPERFIKMMIMALRKNPKFGQCSKESIMECAMIAAGLGLEVNTPLHHAYLIPYGRECTFQTDYRGEIELVMRSGHVVDIYAECVFEGDTYIETKGLHRDLVHEPSGIKDASLIRAYAVAVLKNGISKFVSINQNDIDKIMKKVKGGNVWKEWPEEMWKKTAIRKLCKMLPKSAVDERHREHMEHTSPFKNSMEAKTSLIDIGSIDYSKRADKAPEERQDSADEVPENPEHPEPGNFTDSK